MKRSKIQAWWADQNKLNPYELTAPYNKCKNTINSLAKIECSIAVIVAFCVAFFYLAESNWDNFISLIKWWLPFSIVVSMFYLMRTDQTSEQAIEIFKKSFDSRLMLWCVISSLVVLVLCTGGIELAESAGALAAAIALGLALALGASTVVAATGGLILSVAEIGELPVANVVLGGVVILAAVVVSALVNFKTAPAPVKMTANLLPAIGIKIRVWLGDLCKNPLKPFTDSRIKRNTLIYLRMNSRYKPEFLPQLSQDNDYNFSVIKREYGWFAWIVMLPACFYRWFIKVNCLPLFLIILLRDFGYKVDGTEENNKLDKFTATAFGTIALFVAGSCLSALGNPEWKDFHGILPLFMWLAFLYAVSIGNTFYNSPLQPFFNFVHTNYLIITGIICFVLIVYQTDAGIFLTQIFSDVFMK